MTQSEHSDTGGNTPTEIVPEHKLAGIDRHWNTDEEWDGHDYSSVPIPDETTRARWEWSTEERRAYILTLLREHGHAKNVPKTQQQLGEEFGVSQQAIHQDYKELRRYIRFHAGSQAISDTEVVAQQAVAKELENGNYYKALRAQLEYNEWLFELGRLSREPTKQQIESVSVKADAADLTDEEESHFETLSEMLNEDDEDDEIIVENTADGDD